MKNTWIIKEEPFVSVINQEWKRAKEILPILRMNKKPRFKWASSVRLGGGTHGRCSRYWNVILVHQGYLKHGLTEDFVKILRHEIAHLPRPSNRKAHGKDFMWWLAKLEGPRFAPMSVTKMAKSRQEVTPVV